jgi:hypothetical protein
MKRFNLSLVTLNGVFALLMSFACESPNEPFRANEEYLPLKMGNKWYYNSNYQDSSSIDIIWELTQQKELNKNTYSEVIKYYLKSNHRDTLYYRLSRDTLFFRSTDDNDQIVADFSLSLNETAYWQNDLKVVQKTKDLITFETPFGADYGYSITFKKGIGMTNLIQNGIVYQRIKLIEAEIR